MFLRGVAVIATGALLASAAPVSDERTVPALQRNFRSASGAFVLRVEAVDGWKTHRAHATLSSGGAIRWSRDLPHQFGPKTAVVTDRGAVLLVDEWINSIPAHGLTLIAPDGRTIADHGGETIFKVLGSPRAAISAQARVGTWRSAEPAIRADQVAIAAAGRTLLISLKDGTLSVTR